MAPGESTNSPGATPLSLSPLMGIMAYLGGGSGGKQRGEAGDKIPRLLHHSLLMATLLGPRKTGVPN